MHGLSLLQESISLPDQLEEAANYIKKLQINVEKMKEKKNTLVGIFERPNNVSVMKRGSKNVGLIKSPKIEIRQVGLAVEVVLITGLDCQFMFCETLRVLQEEGIDIVNASYMVNGDAVFHSIHCQVISYIHCKIILPLIDLLFLLICIYLCN